MSVVVFKDDCMSSDSRVCSFDTVVTDSCKKIHLVYTNKDALMVGFCGNLYDQQRLLEYLYRTLEDNSGVLNEEDFKMGGGSALIYNIVTDKLIKVESKLRNNEAEETSLVFIPRTRSEPIAIGSGVDYAYGALDAGATAEEAVKVAISRNIYCGGQPYTMTVDMAKDIVRKARASGQTLALNRYVLTR